MRLPAGMVVTTSYVVPGPARRCTFEVAIAVLERPNSTAGPGAWPWLAPGASICGCGGFDEGAGPGPRFSSGAGCGDDGWGGGSWAQTQVAVDTINNTASRSVSGLSCKPIVHVSQQRSSSSAVQLNT